MYIFKNLLRNSNFIQNRTKISGTLHEDVVNSSPKYFTVHNSDKQVILAFHSNTHRFLLSTATRMST